MAFRRKRGRKWLVGWKSPTTGKERSRGGFPTAAEAERFKVEVEGLVARGIDWEPPRPVDADAAALAPVVVAYLDDVELKKARHTARQRTMSMKLFMQFLTETTTPATLPTLSKALLTKLVVWLRDPKTSRHKKGRGADHIKKIVEHVQALWAWAYDEERFSPLTPRPMRLDVKAMRSPRTPTKAPTWADMDACISALARPVDGQREQRDIRFAVLVAVVARCTGLRISQIERLLVGDVDVGLGVLTFRGELGKSHQERSGRLLPIAPVLLRVLRRLVADRARTELLIPRREEVAPSNRRERMAEAWRAAGVPEAVWKQRVHHAFRKGFRSELVRAKADERVITFLIGQSSGLAGIYTDPDALDLRGAVEKVAPFDQLADAAIEVAFSSTNASSSAPRTQDGPQ